MLSNWDKAFKHVLESEGGYVFHKDDPGGETNLGCTKKVYEEWVGHPVDSNTMKNLTPEQVAPIYKNKYWDKVKGDIMPSGLDYLLFDMAINSGPGRATKLLQAALSVTADGAIGPATLKAIQAADPKELIEKFSIERLQFYQNLPTFGTFGKGWSRRVAETKFIAEDMIA